MWRGLCVLVSCSVLFGCSVAAKQEMIETALDDRQRRLELFEATLRVLDEEPEYVGEFFKLTQEHQKTLDRFFAEVTAELSKKQLAQLNAKHLTEHPASLRQVMVATLDASAEKPDAQEAISKAIADRPQLAARAIARRPETVKKSFHALLSEAGKQPESREALLIAMQQNRHALAKLLLNNPETARALVGALVDGGMDEIF